MGVGATAPGNAKTTVSLPEGHPPVRTGRIGVLLTKMQAERRHMALVIDEYGGVDGLVTIEDLIEQVIGEIEDEHEGDVEEEKKKRQEQKETRKKKLAKTIARR